MSLKPQKKSDMKKGWMKARRDVPKKILHEYHLIVTEGTDTEPAYFGTIRDIINSKHRGRINLEIVGEGDNTLNLFEKAKNKAIRSPNEFKHVWVVYYTDDFPADHIDKTAQRCVDESTEETKYHAIWSNQCVELWFLLHFSYMHSDLHRKEYFLKLNECLNQINAGEYDKKRKDMFQILLPYIDTAIINAKKLDKVNQGKKPSESSPGTKVYELVAKLKPYFDTSE